MKAKETFYNDLSKNESKSDMLWEFKSKTKLPKKYKFIKQSKNSNLIAKTINK